MFDFSFPTSMSGPNLELVRMSLDNISQVSDNHCAHARQLLRECIIAEVDCSPEPSTIMKIVYFVRGFYYLSIFGRIFNPAKHKLAKMVVSELRRQRSAQPFD